MRTLPARGDGGEMAGDVGAVRRNQRGGGRRRRRARVGDEVADGEVGLVAHARDYRQYGIEDGLRDDFLVECPQVLDRAAATRDDQYIGFGARVRSADCLRDRFRSAVALDRRRINNDCERGPASFQRRDEVAQRRCAGRSHNADHARIRGQGPLATRREPAGGLEARFQSREFLVQRACSGETHVVDVELEFAAGFVD